jgi:hypothetical protein
MRRIPAGLLVLLATGWLAVPARAAWGSSASGAAVAHAATLAPTGTLTASCVTLSPAVRLDWAATSSSWVDGYEVRWGTTPSTYSSNALTSGLTYTTPALPLGTYYFVVRATKNGWRSADSNEASKTIVSVLGVGTCQ